MILSLRFTDADGRTDYKTFIRTEEIRNIQLMAPSGHVKNHEVDVRLDKGGMVFEFASMEEAERFFWGLSRLSGFKPEVEWDFKSPAKG